MVAAGQGLGGLKFSLYLFQKGQRLAKCSGNNLSVAQISFLLKVMDLQHEVRVDSHRKHRLGFVFFGASFHSLLMSYIRNEKHTILISQHMKHCRESYERINPPYCIPN